MRTHHVAQTQEHHLYQRARTRSVILWEVSSNVSEKQLYSKGSGQARDGGQRLVVESSSSSIVDQPSGRNRLARVRKKETLISVILMNE